MHRNRLMRANSQRKWPGTPKSTGPFQIFKLVYALAAALFFEGLFSGFPDKSRKPTNAIPAQTALNRTIDSIIVVASFHTVQLYSRFRLYLYTQV